MIAKVVRMQFFHGPTLLAPNPLPHAKASNTMPTDDEPLITCVYASKCKCHSMALQITLGQDNDKAQAPYIANAK
jgi:hypothetical protein